MIHQGVYCRHKEVVGTVRVGATFSKEGRHVPKLLIRIGQVKEWDLRGLLLTFIIWVQWRVYTLWAGGAESVRRTQYFTSPFGVASSDSWLHFSFCDVLNRSLVVRLVMVSFPCPRNDFVGLKPYGKPVLGPSPEYRHVRWLDFKCQGTWCGIKGNSIIVKYF